jgi:HD-like signal output (HDOD) protein
MFNTPTAPTYQSGQRSVAPSGTVTPELVRGAALEFLGKLATEVSSGTVELPCFPDIMLRIRNTLADPKNTPGKTVTIIGAEPRLAARLLQTANSAAFNPSGRPLTELRAAITRLGHQVVQSAAMAYAVHHMKDQEELRAIAKPLRELWQESIAVASICQVVARRTKVSPDEAFLTGLLHGIGRLYIMARAATDPRGFNENSDFMDLISGWHASIGKAVLENWGFAEEMSEAIGDQADYARKRKHDAELSDILIVSILMAEALKQPAPRLVDTDAALSFATVGLSPPDCTAILTHAEYQLGSLQDALGC